VAVGCHLIKRRRSFLCGAGAQVGGRVSMPVFVRLQVCVRVFSALHAHACRAGLGMPTCVTSGGLLLRLVGARGSRLSSVLTAVCFAPPLARCLAWGPSDSRGALAPRPFVICMCSSWQQPSRSSVARMCSPARACCVAALVGPVRARCSRRVAAWTRSVCVRVSSALRKAERVSCVPCNPHGGRVGVGVRVSCRLSG
jgi:hypothetical protein